MGLLDRLQNAWNAFVHYGTQNQNGYRDYGYVSSINPDKASFTKGNERSIVTAIYNRIAIDCSAIDIRHVRLDEKGRFQDYIDSRLDSCLHLEANIDQTARMFMQDAVITLLDEGCIAIVPVDTTKTSELSESYDIETLRVGKIVEWYPRHVKIELYNDRIGKREEITMPKKDVAIVTNPLYAVINDRNSIAQRLVRKMNILDAIDEQSGSGKLDLIIQLPYVVRSDTRKEQAEKRRQDIENQLAGSKYGIAYTDGTEKITQLNRSVENNLMKTIEYLTSMLYSQLGITAEIMNGTANSDTMMNYQNRTIEPMISAIVDEMNRKFLTSTARTQRQCIKYFNDPFKLIPITNLAEIADKFTRNEIMSANEIRQVVGLKPVDDENADALRNKNLNSSDNPNFASTKEVESDEQSNTTETVAKEGDENQNGE